MFWALCADSCMAAVRNGQARRWPGTKVIEFAKGFAHAQLVCLGCYAAWAAIGPAVEW